MRSKLGAIILFAAVSLLPALAADQTKSKDPEDQQVQEKTGRRRIRLGGLMFGAGYSHVSGYPYGYGWPYRYYGSPWAWAAWPMAYPFYDAWWPSPFFHPGFFNGFGYGPNMGEVKINTPTKNAAVFLDGAFAGTADKLKNIWLEPGAYNLELRAGGGSYQKKIYVLSGKRLTIEPDFRAQSEQERQP